MAHKLSGRWTSTVINSDGEEMSDDRFDLVIDDGGTVDPKTSSHARRRLKRGHASIKNVERIELVDADGTLYGGKLIEETSENMKLCGFRRLNAEEPVDELDRSEGDRRGREGKGSGRAAKVDHRLRAQEVIIWVATKP